VNRKQSHLAIDLPSSLRRTAHLAALLGVLGTARMAYAAEEAAPQPEGASAADSATEASSPEAGVVVTSEVSEVSEASETSVRSITLKVTVGDSTLSAEAIERAIEQELSIVLDATETAPDLELTLADGRVVARAQASGGRIVERSMTLPPSEEEQLQVIVLLSENLLYDEASAVLGDLPPKGPPAAAPLVLQEDVPPPAEKEPSAPFFPLGISFTRDLALPSKNYSVAFALSVPDGQWRSIQGLGIAAVSLSSRQHSEGVGIAAIMHEAGSFDGISIAGIYDRTTDEKGSHRGISIAGIYSQSAGDVLGLQIAGLMSGAATSLSGLQIAGLMSSASKSLTGLQIASFNQAGSAKYGMQIGVINYAEQGGAQIGLVNIRRKGDGPQLGLIGVGPSTRMQITSWVQGLNLEPLEGGMPSGPTANIGLRIQTKYVTSMVHLGFGAETTNCGPQNDCGTGAALVIPGYTVGGRLPLSKVWSLELDVQHRLAGFDTSLYSPDMLALRGSVVARVHPLLAFFVAAGPELVFPTVSPVWVREHLALGIQVL
jgi:hypothetical protein